MIVLPSLALAEQAAPSLAETLSIGPTTKLVPVDQLNGAAAASPPGFATLLINAMGQTSKDRREASPNSIAKANKAALNPMTNNGSLEASLFAHARTAPTAGSLPTSDETEDELEVAVASQSQPPLANQKGDDSSTRPPVPGDSADEPDDIDRNAPRQAVVSEQGASADKLEQTADYHKDSLDTAADHSTPLPYVVPAFAQKMISADKGNGTESAEAATDATGTSIPPPITGMHKVAMDLTWPLAPVSAYDGNTAVGMASSSAEQNADDIADRTETQENKGQNTVQLQLELPGLGMVRVHISANGHSISARVVVQEESDTPVFGKPG